MERDLSKPHKLITSVAIQKTANSSDKIG